MSMRVYATDHHSILLDQPEAGGSLPSAGDDALPTLRPSQIAEPP